MPSAVFLAWASFILACPLAAASLASSVAAVACALTLSSSPIGRLPFLAPLGPIMGRPGRGRNLNRGLAGWSSSRRRRSAGPAPQVRGAAETSGDEPVDD